MSSLSNVNNGTEMDLIFFTKLTFKSQSYSKIDAMLFCINGIIQQSKNQTLYSCVSIGSKPVENKKKICSNKFQKEILTIKEILSPESKNLSSVNYLDEFLAKFNGDQSQLMVGNIIHAINDANSLKNVLKLTKQIK